MYLYKLTPDNTGHDDWHTSTHFHECLVYAPSEQRAREFASAEFYIGSEVRGLNENTALSPWENHDLARCELIGDILVEDYREGRIAIAVPDGTVESASDPNEYIAVRGRSWRVVAEGEPPSQAVSVGQAVEHDEALPVAIERSVGVGQALETDEALPVTPVKSSSVLHSLQQHGEGAGVDQGNRAELTLKGLQIHAEGHVGGGSVRNVDLSADIAASGKIGAEAEVIRRSEIAQQSVRIFRVRLIEAPEEIAHSVRFAITQLEQRLAYLKDQRSNSPEAGDAIEALERHGENLQTLLEGVERGDAPDQSVERWQRMLDLLLDSVERFIASDALVRTTFLGVAVSTCAVLGVSELVQAIVAVSAVGADRKILDGVRGLFKGDKAD